MNKDGKNQYGIRKLVKGEINFFLQPGETISEGKINDVCVLQDNESFLL